MSLKVWLPLNGDTHNQGCSKIDYVDNTGTLDNAGKIGKCYSFGTNTYLTYNNVNIPTNCWSVACWAYSTAGSVGAHQYIVSLNTSTSTDFTFSLCNYNNKWCIRTGGTTYEGPSRTINTWEHIAATYDGTTLKLYVNGNLSLTQTSPAAPVAASTLRISGRMLSGCSFLGKVNDVRIYDHVLSEAEVKGISQGLILHYKLDGNGFGNPNLLANSKLDGSWTYPSSSYSDKYSPTTTSIPTASQYTLSFEAKSTVDGDKIRTHYYSPNTTTAAISNQGVSASASDGFMAFTLTTNWEKYWVIYSQDETTAVKHIICPRLVSGNGTGTVSVRNVKLEEGNIATSWCPNTNDALFPILGMDKTIIDDSSGYEYNGNIIGQSPTSISDSPRYQSGIHLGGILSGIATASGTFGWNDLTQLTISAWIRPTQSVSSWSGGIGIAIMGNDSNKRRFVITDYADTFRVEYANGSYSTLNSGKTLTVNEWHFCAATLNGTEVKMYFDGELVSTQTIDWGSSTLDSDMIFEVGIDSHGSYGIFTGDYSDVRLYCTPLSAEDIKTLYDTSMRIDKSGNTHNFEIKEDYSYQPDLSKTGILKNKNFFEQKFLFNDKDGWTFQPTGEYNIGPGAGSNMVLVDFSQFYQSPTPVQFHIEYDISWANITPNNNGTFQCWTQGNCYNAANHSFDWNSTNYFAASNSGCGGIDLAALMQANSTGSTHVSKDITAPVEWLASYSKARFGARIDYATGDYITLSNLKVTLLQDDTTRFNSQFFSANKYIEM